MKKSKQLNMERIIKNNNIKSRGIEKLIFQNGDLKKCLVACNIEFYNHLLKSPLIGKDIGDISDKFIDGFIKNYF